MIAPGVRLGRDVFIPQPDQVSLYGCCIGDETRIGPIVEIENGAGGGPRCNISSHGSASTGHGSIGKGVRLEEGVFVGHGVKFVNDADPWAVNADGSVPSATDWVLLETLAGARASIGGSAKILGGATIGEGALVGAGAVVTQDVPAHCVVVGAPAKVHGPRSAVRQRSQ